MREMLCCYCVYYYYLMRGGNMPSPRGGDGTHRGRRQLGFIMCGLGICTIDRVHATSWGKGCSIKNLLSVYLGIPGCHRSFSISDLYLVSDSTGTYLVEGYLTSGVLRVRLLAICPVHLCPGEFVSKIPPHLRPPPPAPHSQSSTQHVAKCRPIPD